jgi:galactose oxidase-like protein
MEKRDARWQILGFFLALAPCVQPPATAAVPPLTIEGLTASFDENGVLIQPTIPLAGLWSWRYTLTTYGRAGLQFPAPPPVLIADAEKRELVRPGLREVYEVKDTIKGFEQSFIIEQPPPGQGSILLEGFVTTDLEREGGVRLPNRVAYLLNGFPQLQYANLAVRDATGRALAARMDWTEEGQTISLWIDEEGQYPITVDPGIGSCSCGNPIPAEGCWCTAVNLCYGATACLDPMHAALSPLKIDGSVGGAAFFYRTMEPGDAQDQNKMAMFEGGSSGSAGYVMQWDSPPPFPHLACSGHSFLPDGRLFIAGGNFDDGLAPNDAYIWRDDGIPPENALQATSDDNKMHGEPADLDPEDCEATPIATPEAYPGFRWYPTTIPLWDGRIMVIGGQGYEDPEEDPDLDIWNNSYEYYSPALQEFEYSNDFRVKDSAGNNICENGLFTKTCHQCWDYPRYHAIPEGLFLAGQLHSTYLFSYEHLEGDDLLQVSSGPFSHEEVEASRHDGGWVTLEVDLNNDSYNQQRRVLMVGGFGVPGDPGPPEEDPEHLDTAEVFDALADPFEWRWTCTGSPSCIQTKMQRARQYPKMVLLPNRMVLIVGGEKNNGDGENSSEIFDPMDETFGYLLEDEDGLDKDRRYHSEAFLLPDGRVITAGDDTLEVIDPEENGATYNVYYPTFMTQARPIILASPALSAMIQWNVDLNVCVSGISQESEFHSVILVRPSSTTHSIDFDHRQVRLPAHYDGESCGSTGKKIVVDMPAYPESGDWRRHVLPPGYYMLIVRKSDGESSPPIPSAAKFIQLVLP